MRQEASLVAGIADVKRKARAVAKDDGTGDAQQVLAHRQHQVQLQTNNEREREREREIADLKLHHLSYSNDKFLTDWQDIL